jgi:hypothetical protein
MNDTEQKLGWRQQLLNGLVFMAILLAVTVALVAGFLMPVWVGTK